MKTVIGFVCGIVGFLLAVVTFLVGVAAGFSLGVSDKVSVTPKTNKTSYTSYSKRYEKKED